MNLNVTLIGQIIFALSIVMAFFGYYMGKRKTGYPKLTALACAVSALIPIIAIVLAMTLLLKKDIESA